MAQLAGREAAGACAGQGHGPVRRRGHRGGAPADRAADRGHRRAADGRHERGRRSLRRGQDVPAAGGQERARHEEGGRPPAALHRGREDRDVAAQGQDRHGDGQGRRPRHRQEHRGRGPAVQQLRGHRPRRHGAVPGDPEVGQRQSRRHDRPVGPDHAVARRDGDGGRGDDAAGLQAAVADRRRHHVEGAHRAQDRAALQRHDGARARRLARGRRLHGAGFRIGRPGARLRGQGRGRVRSHPRRARRRQEGKGRDARDGARQRLPHRLVGLHAAQARRHRARASSPSIRCTSWSSASTGRRSSAPGSWPATIPPSSRTRWWARARASSTPTRARCWTISCARSG